ncbi:MAG TPA: type II toxin-antitoxin system RelE/ParE family toxin [Burkholderiaceae bacterium]|nr:type II toxin-antitoxin system RelE/ParE family toxin [Burkholderiaceae bacterium]
MEILPQAEAEIREAFLWYFERSPLAADAFRTEVFDAIDGLALSADTWPADEDSVRRHVLSHFPYTVHYEVARWPSCWPWPTSGASQGIGAIVERIMSRKKHNQLTVSGELAGGVGAPGVDGAGDRARAGAGPVSAVAARCRAARCSSAQSWPPR